MTYILILTLTLGNYSTTPVIHSISFADEKSCISAGELWTKNLPQTRILKESFVCVPTGVK